MISLTCRRSLLLAAAALALPAAASAAPVLAPAAKATCHGYPVTTGKSSGVITGTAKRDVIRLTGPGRVRSGAGDDIICGSRFADVIEAGAGRDVVLGGAGHDRIHGGAGDDALLGEGDNDHVEGGPGADTLMGGAGRNRVVRHRARGAGENGIADRVLGGTRAVTILSDAPDVAALADQGNGFVFDWQPAEILPGAIPDVGLAWQVAQPSMVTVVAFGDAVQAFNAFGTIEPGAVLFPAGQLNTRWGQQVVLGPDMILAPGEGGVPVSVLLWNQWLSATTMGIAIGTETGLPGMIPALAAEIGSNTWQAFRQPTSLRVRVADQSTRQGQWLPPLPPFPTLTVDFASGKPTKGLRFSMNSGFTS